MAKKKTTEVLSELPRLVSYTLKATIRTGEYESLSPAITVEAETIEQAHEFAMGHIKDLTNKYSTNVQRTSTPVEPVFLLSEHYQKVLKAITSTSDGLALKGYEESVDKSVKLTALEKKLLHEAITNQLLK